MDLDAVCERARATAAGVIAEDAVRIDSEASWPESGIRALQAAGLGGLVVAEEHGGLGHGVLGILRVCEEIGRHCASTAISFGMHLVGSAVIGAKATPDQVERYLRPIARGAHLTTLSLSEPGTGSEFFLPQSQLRRAAGGGGYVLSGTKSFVTNGGFADSYVVSALMEEENLAAGQFSMVVVPAGAKGMSWREPWNGFGMRGNSSRTADLHKVHVAARDLLGREGDQIWYVFHVVAPYFLSAMSGTYLGVAARAFEEALRHLGSRRHEHSGKALAESPILQQRIASLWLTVERARRYAYWAAAEYDNGGPQGLKAVLLSKVEVADSVTQVVNEAMTLVGGIGYGANSALCRLLRDARAAHVMAPTTDYLRLWGGRMLLDLPVLAE